MGIASGIHENPDKLDLNYAMLTVEFHLDLYEECDTFWI